MTAQTCDNKQDSGIFCLTLLARLHELPADPVQIEHEFGTAAGPLDTGDIVRAARWLGLKARAVQPSPATLKSLRPPYIARLHGSRYALIGAVDERAVLLREPHKASPETITVEAFEAGFAGEVILATRRAGLSGGGRRFDFSWFVPFIIKYKRYLGDVLIASFFVQIFGLLTPLFFQVIVDKVLVHQGLTTLDILALGVLMISIFEVVLSGLRTYVFAHTTNRIDAALGGDLFRHLLRLPIAYFESRRVGDTVARVRELESIRNFITGSSITLVIDFFFTIVFFAVLYWYSPKLSLIVLASLPLYTALAVLITPLLRARLHEKFNRGADNQAYLVECVSAITTLKAAAVEPSVQRRWEERLAAYLGASFRATNLGNIGSETASLINKLTVLGILWFGARLVIEGALSVGQLIAFNMIAARISGPILRLVQIWQEFQQAGISVQRLGDILNARPEPARIAGRGALPKLRGRVTLEDVRFRYRQGAAEVLRGLNLEIEAGAVIGIVGRSGSGKSTLAKLIQRFYVPDSGRVLIDGVDLALIDPAWLRCRIGVVLQENVLLNRSVMENIAISDPTMALERVIGAAKLAGAHEFILTLPHGYDTILDERAANLSGGQRQRIAIARALITDPRILIFDEATSALDFESEAVIQHNMHEISRGRTVIVIAHRLASLKVADRIFVIENGEIVEMGEHAELLQREGYYARLYEHQVAMLAV